MKTRKLIIAATIGLLFTALELNAQPRQTPMAPPPPDSIHIQKMVDAMGKELALSKEQKSEISQIFFDQMAIQKKKHIETEANRILEHQKKREAINEKIKSLLTNDQAVAFVVFEETHKPECPPMPPKHCREKH